MVSSTLARLYLYFSMIFLKGSRAVKKKERKKKKKMKKIKKKMMKFMVGR